MRDGDTPKPRTWEELVSSCHHLDQAHIRIESLDISSLEEGGTGHALHPTSLGQLSTGGTHTCLSAHGASTRHPIAAGDRAYQHLAHCSQLILPDPSPSCQPMGPNPGTHHVLSTIASFPRPSRSASDGLDAVQWGPPGPLCHASSLGAKAALQLSNDACASSPQANGMNPISQSAGSPASGVSWASSLQSDGSLSAEFTCLSPSLVSPLPPSATKAQKPRDADLARFQLALPAGRATHMPGMWTPSPARLRTDVWGCNGVSAAPGRAHRLSMCSRGSMGGSAKERKDYRRSSAEVSRLATPSASQPPFPRVFVAQLPKVKNGPQEAETLDTPQAGRSSQGYAAHKEGEEERLVIPSLLDDPTWDLWEGGGDWVQQEETDDGAEQGVKTWDARTGRRAKSGSIRRVLGLFARGKH